MVLDLMIVEDEKKKAQPGKRSLVVHLHEDHPKDRDALTLVERLVEDEVPLTLVFGEENFWKIFQKSVGSQGYGCSPVKAVRELG